MMYQSANRQKDMCGNPLYQWRLRAFHTHSPLSINH